MKNYFEDIDDYLGNQLSEIDKADFEKAMSQDEKLRHAVDNYPLLHQLSASLIEDEVREELKKLQLKKLSKETPKIKIFDFKNLLGVAASLTFILVSTTRGEEDASSKLDSAIYLFELNRFDEALLLLEAIPTMDSLAKLNEFYKANVYLNLKKYKAAEPLFITLLDHPQFGNQASYNLMICYIFTDQKNLAKPIFNRLLQEKLINEDRINLLNKLFTK
jgi:hypothetical protein